MLEELRINRININLRFAQGQQVCQEIPQNKKNRRINNVKVFFKFASCLQKQKI